MKLQAVVEQLQKQQQHQQQQQQQPAVPMDCRERRREPQVPFPTPPFPAQPRAGPAGRAPAVSPAVPPARAPAAPSRPCQQGSRNSEDEEEEEDDEEDEEEDEEDGAELEDGAEAPGRESCSALKYFRAPKAAHPNQRVASASSPVPALGQPRGAQQGKEEQGKDSAKHSGAPAGRPGWRLDEQLKQNGGVTWSDEGDGCRGREISRDFAKLYELDSDPERKEFLDDLFVFMQKRGTPINRIPIMAKQILDLYMLYKLVTEKGGLVEIINKKIWREITKGLNLPTSITSAAFTLRTHEIPVKLNGVKLCLSHEGMRSQLLWRLRFWEGFRAPKGSFSPSPQALSPTKLWAKAPQKGLAPLVSPPCPGDGVPLTVPVPVPGRIAVPAGLGGPQASAAARTATLEQLRERLEAGEPPEKKAARMTEEEQRLVQQALQRNLFSVARQIPMRIKINGKGEARRAYKADSAAAALNLSPNGIGSINMSVEINGTTYAGERALLGTGEP
ncbi:ARI3B protein, partial [Nicator chloris]|nr:ARI3B protein [Nicator chloris]